MHSKLIKHIIIEGTIDGTNKPCTTRVEYREAPEVDAEDLVRLVVSEPKKTIFQRLRLLVRKHLDTVPF